MRRHAFSVLTIGLFLLAGAPGLAQQGGGHGSIYYSPSARRIGWARSMSNDSEADHAASAICRGGNVDATSLQAFQNNKAGISMTGSGPSVNVFENDCSRVIKFDSNANHQCAGFGYHVNGRFSRGVRERNRSQVVNDLSSWPNAFIICNDEVATTGLERSAQGLAKIAQGLNGNNNNNSNNNNNGNLGNNVNGNFGNNDNGNFGNSNGNFGNNSGGNGVVIRNPTNSRVTFLLKCPGESSYQTFSLVSGASNSYDGANWGQSCQVYDFMISTPGAGGATTTLTHTVRTGNAYDLEFNAQKNAFDLLSAARSGAGPGSKVTVINDTNQRLTYTVVCPSKTPTTLAVDANSSAAHHLNCSSGILQVATGTGTDATFKSLPVQDGNTYHLHWDASAQAITIVPGQ